MKSSIAQLVLLASFRSAVSYAGADEPPEFDWASIIPSRSLEYHPCYGSEYRCARLLLPLDWRNTSDPSSTVAIALAKLPATVAPSAASFRGAVFAQPGGPGESGTLYLRGSGRKLRDVVDVPGRQHHDLVAFDPRGTGHSAPRLDCFPGLLGHVRAQERDMAEAVDVSRAALARAVAAGKADGRRCAEEHGDFLRFVGTESVARDMLAILDKIEEEEERQRGEKPVSVEDDESRLELRDESRKEKGKARLQFIGISYGTFLGSAFASLFPDRVGRMVLDGVVNPFGYQDGSVAGIDDMDEMVDLFFQGCFDAGPPRCPLRRGPDGSGADLSRRFWSWASSLEDSPLTIHTPDGSRRYVGPATVRQLLVTAMYHPLADFEPLAAALDAAMAHGDTAALFARILADMGYAPLDDALRANSSAAATRRVDAFAGISCADTVVDLANRTLDDWQAALDRYSSISGVAGPWVLYMQTLCAGWPLRSKWQFPRGGAEENRPAGAAPILFLSNRWDPVTPLRDARIARDAFPGAGLVVQDTMGHCVTLSAPGPCLGNIVAEYFATGAVPKDEITCEAARRVWAS